jgi:hypothetical protein
MAGGFLLTKMERVSVFYVRLISINMGEGYEEENESSG